MVLQSLGEIICYFSVTNIYCNFSMRKMKLFIDNFQKYFSVIYNY